MSKESNTNNDLETRYREIRPRYEEFAKKVKMILVSAFPDDFKIHAIRCRAKKMESFLKKAQKYENPLSEINDLAGIRVITYFPKSLDQIDAVINAQFIVSSLEDVGEKRRREGRFGYQSIHYLIKMRQDRADLDEYKLYKDMVAEVQARTILQHAWAEMEHDIQYKSSEQMPANMEKKLVALAGLISIGDNTFQEIQNEDEEMRKNIAVSDDSELVEKTEMPTPKIARELIAEGNYEEAIAHYSNKIEEQPESYTLYIGRAKARFLNGDRIAAIKDLEHAKKLQPSNPIIKTLLSQIEEGISPSPIIAADAWQLVSKANILLTKGEGDQAFKMYSQAQACGFTFSYSLFNKAMACALNKDADSTNYFLDQYKPYKESPTVINMLALRAIAAHIGKTGYKNKLKELDDYIAKTQWFSFDQSPLRHLEKGFEAKDGTLAPEIKGVFDLLKLNDNSL